MPGLVLGYCIVLQTTEADQGLEAHMLFQPKLLRKQIISSLANGTSWQTSRFGEAKKTRAGSEKNKGKGKEGDGKGGFDVSHEHFGDETW